MARRGLPEKKARPALRVLQEQLALQGLLAQQALAEQMELQGPPALLA